MDEYVQGVFALLQQVFCSKAVFPAQPEGLISSAQKLHADNPGP